MLSNRWRHDIFHDLEYLAKSFNGVSAKVITNEALMRLNIYILAKRYLEKGSSHFTKLIGDDKEMNEETEIVSDSKKEIKLKKALYKENRDVRALLLAAACLSAPFASVPGSLALSKSAIPILRLLELSALLFALLVPLLGSSAPPSILPLCIFELYTPPSALLLPMLGLSALPFALLVLMSRLSTPPFALPIPMLGLFAFLSTSTMPVPVPRSSTLLSTSVVPLLVPGSSALPSLSGPRSYPLPISIWSCLPIPQKVDQ